MIPDTQSPIYAAAALIIPLVLSIVVHEMAHGLVARALGDHTAEQAGRLSFNPLRHVDPFGTIILPGMLALAHAPVFGWARPVPVDARRLHNPRRDMMLVGAAGPASNFVMAALAALALGLMVRLGGGAAVAGGATRFIAENFANFLDINLFLGLFNLLPIPPFDGSHIVEGLLPDRAASAYARTRRFGMLVPIALIVILPLLLHIDLIDRFVGPPFGWLAGVMAQLGRWAAGAA